MKAVKYFEDFINSRIIEKCQIDSSRANFLIKEAKRKHESLNEIIKKIGVSELNAHEIIEISYDVIMGLIRAKLCQTGFKSSGEGAHEAEVSYLRDLGFSENIVQFMDQVRYFRNGIKYYGKTFDKAYAEKVLDFLNKIYPRLLS